MIWVRKKICVREEKDKTDRRQVASTCNERPLIGSLFNQVNCKQTSLGQLEGFRYECVGNDINEFCEWEDSMATHENIYNA